MPSAGRFSELFSNLLNKGPVWRHKKVAMTCAYLGRKLHGVNHVMIMLFTFFQFVKFKKTSTPLEFRHHRM